MYISQWKTLGNYLSSWMAISGELMSKAARFQMREMVSHPHWKISATSLKHPLVTFPLGRRRATTCDTTDFRWLSVRLAFFDAVGDGILILVGRFGGKSWIVRVEYIAHWELKYIYINTWCLYARSPKFDTKFKYELELETHRSFGETLPRSSSKHWYPQILINCRIRFQIHDFRNRSIISGWR